MNRKPKLEVCLSPALLHLYDLSGATVVIVDVLRATSTICTALYNGAARVIPVDTVEKCISLGLELNALTAGERDGKIVPGLQRGNSPFEYSREAIAGKSLVLTTTNGTRLLHMARNAADIITGSFPNLTAVCDYLVSGNRHVVIACAAWKNRVNMEDVLFAGAVINRIRDRLDIACDSAIIAESLYLQAKGNIFNFLKNAAHFKRLTGYGLEKDIVYCLTQDIAGTLPVYRNGELVSA
ncbi:MAG TPA: 2-phosphosulfolactate phosphatase [Chitinophagaceae bacterium]|nr:2-phosphosulfolactate phosphatase [Chitinophagaceae bacterium]